MKIYDFIKAGYIAFLKAKIKAFNGNRSSKDIDIVKKKLFAIEDGYEPFEVEGYQECLDEEITSKEYKNTSIIFNDKYNYNYLTNTISKITSEYDNNCGIDNRMHGYGGH